MKNFLRIFYFLLFLILIFLIYLSTFGIETKRLNNQISNKIKNIDENLIIELRDVKIILNPLKLKLNAKTIGSNFIIDNKVIEIESIKTNISLISLIKNEFSLDNLEISTKSLEIKNLLSFLRVIQNTTQLYILEKIIQRGYLIADININFDKDGKIKDNFKINGFVKDVKLDLLKKYNVKKLNFIFKVDKNSLSTKNLDLNLNNLDFTSEKILFKKKDSNFFIEGELNNKKLELDENSLNFFIKEKFLNLDVNKIKFSSNNIFSFKIDKNYKFKNFKITSDLKIDQLAIINKFKLKNIFPEIKKELNLLDHNLKINYENKKLSINGNGNILFQNEKDLIDYSISSKNKVYEFNSELKIKQNPLYLEILNFKNNQDIETMIKLQGRHDSNKKTIIKIISLKEKNNEILAKNIIFNNKNEFVDLDYIKLDYYDVDNQKNSAKIYKKNKEYFLEGLVLNIDNLIEKFLKSDNSNNLNVLNKELKLNINLNEVHLDKDHIVQDFFGNLSFNKQKINKAKLSGSFSKNKKFKFTVNSSNSGKVTTLFLDKAEPIVKRYNFIKGFEGGALDFHSSEIGEEIVSTIKIYDFKLMELPTLTKILTLASLQGIADILSGEGIRFDEFEMNFKTKDNLLTIDEIYAIGPAISILMDGYVEKNKLISLRGTLVPATTINKAIGSIPILGDILVGSKTGEGVFGVSFKIKGVPKNLETTVNPIKTLTPRFITRTLEKIKKN